MQYHVIATLSGGRKKSVYNKTDEQALALVVQFLKNGTISATWGSRSQTYQVLELRCELICDHSASALLSRAFRVDCNGAEHQLH